ncbi:hypothetical protein NC797_16950 [Aquibacillus sp. 3ASR75-11]|uniref:Permuted papain-like amidase YaeF/Yiix C92 family enzyme n=1 Tax=Terrihalobacillus insolitus TaxID=2950438 RepID=A0A9X4AN67_9BACI|nr:hypothetical protein [Terrihalobacillus insolitus]MDC3413527.1 hypothetical protein [Terrihalobacillus insolitus]MDC3426187.1 hypothetical protein [Terrihalobacillus insolitus]
MNTKKVYLLFSDTGSILTRAINIYTKSTLNHASIAFDPDLIDVYSFGRKRARNPFVGGFVKENVREDFFQSAVCAIYSFSISNTEYVQLRTAVEQFEHQKSNYKYNFLGLFAVALNKEFQRKNTFFCSEFIAALLSECGIYKFDKPNCLMKPQDLRDWQQLQLVYRGILGAYPHFMIEPDNSTLIQEINKV